MGESSWSGETAEGLRQVQRKGRIGLPQRLVSVLPSCIPTWLTSRRKYALGAEVLTPFGRHQLCTFYPDPNTSILSTYLHG